MEQKQLRYALAIGIGAIIFFSALMTDSLLEGYQKQSLKVERDSAEQMLKNHIKTAEDHLFTIASSLEAFYIGSERVEQHEFEAFAKKTLAYTIPTTNILILEKGTIIQSYQHDKFIGSSPDLLENYPRVESESSLLPLEFTMSEIKNEDLKVVLVVPIEIFLEDVAPDITSKIVIINPETDKVLFKQGMVEGKPITDFDFTSYEKENLIDFEYYSDLIDYNNGKNVFLRYQIFNLPTIHGTNFGKIILGLGTIFSIVVPLLLIRSEKLNESLRKTNQMLENYSKKLKQANKAKDEFTAMISHELKTPLIPIQGYCELLLDGTLGEINEKQKQKIKIMYDNTQSLADLIQNILDVHKLELGKVKLDKNNVNAQDLLKKCIANFKPLADLKGIRLTWNGSDKNIVVKCDKKRILQVLNNLVSNAIKFVPQKSGKIELYVKKEYSTAVFSVTDNGDGIPIEKQQYLFNKFYQVDTSLNRNSGGAGLGLAICKGLIKEHDGRIWVESKPKSGAKFFFSIPLGDTYEEHIGSR